VPVRDHRTVGEHLAESDALTRESLLDVTPSHAAAMVRTWGRVVPAAQLWAVLRPYRWLRDLRVGSEGAAARIGRVHRSQRGWSFGQGPCPQDQRLVRRRSLAKLGNASSSDDALRQSFWGRPAMTDQHDLNSSEQLWSPHTSDDSSQTQPTRTARVRGPLDHDRR
jgi:hypothetical protein